MKKPNLGHKILPNCANCQAATCHSVQTHSPSAKMALLFTTSALRMAISESWTYQSKVSKLEYYLATGETACARSSEIKVLASAA